MKKANKTNSNLYFDIANVGIVFFLYLINNSVLKGLFKHTCAEWFFIGYFNDLICPIGFLSYLNIVGSFSNKRIERLLEIQIWMLGAGLVWEFVAPIAKPGSVTDLWDLMCYQFGGILYYLIIILKKRFIERGKNEKVGNFG